MMWLKKYMTVWLFLGVWEIVSRLGWVDSVFIPPFSKVLLMVWDLSVSGVLIEHTWISLQRALAGFLIAALLGTLLGFLLGGWFQRLKVALDLLVLVFSQTNPFILFHIILLFLGIGESVKITIIAWSCIWPVLSGTVTGIQTTNPALLKAARAFGISRWSLFTKVVIPAAAPGLFTGLRLSATYSLFMLIAAEMMGSNSGLGWFILNSQESFQVTKILAAAVVIAVLGLLLDGILHKLQNWAVPGEHARFVNSADT